MSVSVAGVHRSALGVAVVAALAVVIGTLTALVPVTYRVDVAGADTPDEIPGWERIGQPSLSRITITAFGSGVTIVGRPELVWPELFNEAMVAESEGFTWDQATLSFQSTGPGRLVLTGAFSDVRVPVLSGTTSERVDLERVSELGVMRESVTQADLAGRPVAVVQLSSPNSEFARTGSFRWRAGQAAWPGPGPDRVTTWVAGQDVGDSLDGVTPMARMASAALAALGAGLAGTAAALAILWLAWLVGAVVDPRGPPGLGRQVIRALMALCVAFAVGNTLAYVLAARWAAVVVAIGAGLLIVVRLARSPRGHLARGARELASAHPWVLVPALILFFPLLAWGSWFAGAYKTDLYEYATLASIARDNSLLSMQSLPLAQASGTLTSGAGISWRSIDSISAAMVSQWFGIGTVPAFVVLALVLFLAFGLAVLAIAGRINGGRRIAPLVGLALLNPLFVGLFVEGYYSQYVFVALIPGLVLVLDDLIDPVEVPSRWVADRTLLWAVAAVSAVLTAVYPYFFVVVVGGLAITALARARWRRRGLACILPIAWRTFLLVSIGLIPALNFSETAVFQEGLDAIARYVLLSPYSGSERVFLALGFIPYQWREYSAPAEEYMGDIGELAWRLAAGAGTAGLEMLIGSVLLLLLFLVLSAPGRQFRTFAAFASTSIIVLWLAFGAYYLFGDRPYPSLKGFWTAAALLPLGVAAATWRPRLHVAAVGCIAALTLLWGRTIVADRVDWLLTRDGQQAAFSHSSIQPDLARVADVFAEHPSLVALARGPQPISGTDRDRVALAHIQVLARDADLDCAGCDGNGVPEAVSCEAGPDVVVLVGVSGRSKYCGRPLLFRTRVIEVFR